MSIISSQWRLTYFEQFSFSKNTYFCCNEPVAFNSLDSNRNRGPRMLTNSCSIIFLHAHKCLSLTFMKWLLKRSKSRKLCVALFSRSHERENFLKATAINSRQNFSLWEEKLCNWKTSKQKALWKKPGKLNLVFFIVSMMISIQLVAFTSKVTHAH